MTTATPSSEATASSNSNKKNVYQSLVKLHSQNATNEASTLLNDAIKYHKYQMMSREIQSSGSMELQFYIPQLFHLGGDYQDDESSNLSMLQKTNMSFSVSAPPVQQQQQYGQQLPQMQEETSPWSMSIGGSSTVQKGEGHANGQVSIGYDLVQGTNVNLDVDVGQHGKVTLGSTRITSSKTLITTSVSTIPQSDKLAFSISSHRAMFDNTIRAMYALGISSDLGLHYCLLSFTTLDNGETVVTMEEETKKGKDGKTKKIKKTVYHYPPKYTVKFNMGIDQLPLQLQADKIFSKHDQHVGSCSFGWGPSGIQLSASLSRVISQYAKFKIGVKSSSITQSLTWLFKIERGSLALSIPITIAKFHQRGGVMNNLYSLVYLTLLSSLVDGAIGDLLYNERLEELLMDDVSDKGTMNNGEENDHHHQHIKSYQNEVSLMDLEKVKKDAMQQMELMKKPAQAKKEEEERKENGLVILKAMYGLEPNNKATATVVREGRKRRGDVLDVTVQLQFWVMNSSLRLPACTKSNMLGFYDVRLSSPSILARENNEKANVDHENEGGIFRKTVLFCKKALSSMPIPLSTNSRESTAAVMGENGPQQQLQNVSSGDVPMLTVRYKFGNGVYEITIHDEEELILPSPKAFCLGSSDLIS
mmetsp:Transcript_32654/g.43403  ORF Transcript_32654/g.43403 Transcript_32654/m.43403 type:complete len:646 (-) Transcript_32654:165-2102(-)